MAKQVETRNRFRISAEVEAEELGPRLVQLANLGLQNISHELITDVITFKGNPQRTVHDTTGDVFAREWLKDHPTFRVLELVQHFRSVGRTSGSAYTAVRNLIESNELVKTGPGMYRRADVKALEAPKESQRGKHSKTRQGVTNWDLIRNAIKNRKRITSAELRALFKEEGRNDKSISPIITKMRDAKMVKDISPGEYEILKPPPGKTQEKAKEKDRLRKQAERDAAKVKLNGTLPTTSEDTTHG